MTPSMGFCYEPSFSSMPSSKSINKKSVHLRIFPKNFIVTHRGLSIKDINVSPCKNICESGTHVYTQYTS